MNVTQLVLDLFAINAVKFGDFILKSGIHSPIYLDLRVTISYPKILQTIADLMWQQIKELSFDLICPVPYTAIPFATLISVQHDVPMLLRRKEAKQHGTHKIIEGNFTAGQKCLIVEDLVTSGTSILETIAPLKQCGLEVTDAVILLDREQNGKAKLAAEHCELHSVLTLPLLLDILKNYNHVSQIQHQQVLQFLDESQF